MKEIRIWGREGFFRKIRCDYYEMKDKRLVFQIERYYIHFIDIFKKTDKMFNICLS